MKYLLIILFFFHCNKELSTEQKSDCQTCTKVLVYETGKRDTLYSGDKFCDSMLIRMKEDNGYEFNGAKVIVDCK